MRPRTRREQEEDMSGSNPAVNFVFMVFLFLVFAAGTFVTKLVFVWALDRAFPD